jgi:AbrB family looped-hinge helix DNA binding protein
MVRRPKKICCPEGWCASVRVGERGQIVIPYELRETLDIKSGDTLIVCRKGDSILVFKSEKIRKFLSQIQI